MSENSALKLLYWLLVKVFKKIWRQSESSLVKPLFLLLVKVFKQSTMIICKPYNEAVTFVVGKGFQEKI